MGEKEDFARMYGQKKADQLYGEGGKWAGPTPVTIGGTTAGPLVTPEARVDKPAEPAKPAVPPPNANPTGFAQPKSWEDMVTPGAGQQAFDWYGGAFFDPTTGQNLWGDIGKDFTAPGVNEKISGDLAEGLAKKGTQGDSYGADYWQGIQGQTDMPGWIEEAWSNAKGLEADVGGFYDNAFNDAQRKLNRQQAARGRLNSTDSIRAAGEQANQFAGARAKAESDYRLERGKLLSDLAVKGTGAKKDWLTGMSDIAFNAADEEREYADTASQIADRAQTSELERMKGAFDAAFGVDNASTSRLVSGMEAAFGAQDLFDTRNYKDIENKILLGDKTVDVFGKAGAGDPAQGDPAISTGLAAEEDARRAEEARMQAEWQAYLDSFALAAEALGKGAGGATAPTTPTTTNYAGQLSKPKPP